VYYDISYTYTDQKYEFQYGRQNIHRPKEEAVKEDNWLQMNARNYMCEAVHQGIIKRIAPGVFVFP
jgi:transposase